MRAKHPFILSIVAAVLLAPMFASAQGADKQAAAEPSASKSEAANKSLGVAKLAAVVSADGKLLRGAGVVSSKRAFAGAYELTFNRSIVGCTLTATSGTENVAMAMLRVPISSVDLASLKPKKSKKLKGSPSANTLSAFAYLTNNRLSDSAFSAIIYCWK